MSKPSKYIPIIWTALGACALGACPPEPDPDEEFCRDAPLLTWNNFGRGFVTQHCQSCHGSEVEGEDRNEAPLDVNFDTVEQVWLRKPEILAYVPPDEPFMPPEGGVSEEDKDLLKYWLRCGVEGT
jgi:uncharacterized membrane protein